MVALAFAGGYCGAKTGRAPAASSVRRGRLSLARLALVGGTPPTPPACTPAQRDAQAAAFNRSTPNANYMASACPSTAILAALQAADPSAGGALTLVNVGANKGYGIAEVTALFRPDLGVTPATVYARLKKGHPTAPADAIRGVCGDGEEAVPDVAPPASPPHLTIHAVEPVPSNVGLLRDLARELQGSPSVTVTVHPGAVGPAPLTRLGYDPASCEHVGQESCQMQVYKPGLSPVTGWTLDGFFAEQGLGRTTEAKEGGATSRRSVVLKIDAEGYDGAILMSAGTGPGSALDAVRAVEFEYHGVGKWGPGTGQVRLQAVIEKLEPAFDCYLEFGSHLVHLTGSCWTEAYEFYQWSNVLCVRRGDDPWAGVAAGLAVWKEGGA